MRQLFLNGSLRLTLVFCLLLTHVGLSQIHTIGEIQQDSDLRVEFYLPDNAAIGSTPERKAAYDSLSKIEKEELFNLVGPYLDTAIVNRKLGEQYRQKNNAKPPSQISFVDWDGLYRRVSTKDSIQQDAIQTLFEDSNQPPIDEFIDCWSFKSTNLIGATSTGINNCSLRSISDPDALANLFSPYYRISANEAANFITLKTNQTTMEVDQYHGRNPMNYFRVHPMGFRMINGTQYGFYKLDYFTIWDYDYGFVVNPYVYLNAFLIDVFFFNAPYLYSAFIGLDIAGLVSSHLWDVERSAVLVGTPTTSYNTYNDDPYSYFAHSVYAAAHEDTFADQSTYANASSPFQGHIELFLSYDKHATYFCNPNGVPLMPAWIISESYLTLYYLWLNGVIDFGQYSAFLYSLDMAFYMTMIERFYSGGNQGQADISINVGEPVYGQILNGNEFIMDTKTKHNVNKKLKIPTWTGFN